jgi:hypothetical protein
MTEKPEIKIRVSPEGIPPELKKLSRWVLWKHVWVEKTQRWAKVPFQPSGKRASSSSPDTWCSFDTAMIVAQLYDGLGFVFNGDEITGIDLDGMVDASGELSEKAKRILEQVPGYAELSPSGRGLHIITRAEPIGDGKRKDGVEAYSTGRYFTFTGHQINGHNSVPDSPQDISPFLAEHFGVTPPAEKTDLDIACAELPRTFYQKVNDLAMKAFAAWVPQLFPDAIPYQKGGYRVSSDSLRRQLEEDISIVPEGIKDFGVADQGDSRGGKRSPIDLVIEWGGAKDAQEAANRLCGYLGVDPVAMGGKASAKPAEVGDFVQAAQFASDQRIEWHIKHVIPKRGLIVVYGAPGSSKSFFVLDLVAHVARGLPWRGHRVKQSRIAYVAAEGVAGFGNRLAAYSKFHAIPLAEVPVFVRGGALMLNESAIGIMESVNALGDVGIVVIDTLAAVTPGANENTSEDMGEAIKSANLITEGTGASVILIHHANKQGEMRGWSGLLAAADNTIRVEHEEATGLRAAHVEKQKEGRSDGKYGYRLRVVELGSDEDGDTITSCAVEPCEETAPNTRTEKKERKSRSGDFQTSKNFRKARAYMATLEALIEASPDNQITMKEAIEGIQGDATHNQGLENNPDRSNVRKTITSLADHGRVTLELGVIRLPDDLGDAG